MAATTSRAGGLKAMTDAVSPNKEKQASAAKTSASPSPAKAAASEESSPAAQ